MRFAPRLAFSLLAAFAVLVSASRPAAAQCVSLTTLGSPYTQDFNTLANTGTSTVVPAGWAFVEALTSANTTYTAGTGSSNTGDTYSFGGAASSERAFGGLQSGNLLPTIGACFTNNTGVTVSNLAIAYTGEEWRLGTAARNDQLDFEYSLDAANLTTGTWTAVNPLDFVTPNTVAPTGAKDGNNASFRTAISASISPLSIANGATFWIRWLDFNATNADDGLSVDDFSLTPSVLDNAPSVLTTNPPNGATGVGLAANIDVTFSEPVNVLSGWFTISCTVSGLHAAAESGGPTTFTLDPSVNFVANEICTVTIDDLSVSDQDASDPPDNMAADYVWSFDTNPPPPLVINEIDYDQPGSDTAEFLEIRNNGASPVNLDPVVVELVNGNLGGAAVYLTIDLPNVNLAAGGYFVVCSNNTTTPNCNLDVSPNTDLIQNGAPDAVALRWNGVLVDTVSYEGDTGAPYTETSGGGLADDPADDFAGISRFPDGTDTGVNNADLSPRCITPGAANAATTAPCSPPAILGLSVDDVTLAEGQSGTRIFTFTVRLDQPAPGPGGVTFDITTADGTAQDDNPASEDNDYVPQTLTSQNIPAGSDEYIFDVTVNSDTTVESDETFFVNVTNVVGTAVGDPQGLGTLQNDDFAAITLIHDIQGNGASSPEDGNVHTIHGIVTGVKLNGFFVQEEPVDYDADDATSEGILVFTSSAPPAAAQVGNLVYVTGTVSEFVPSADPFQPPLTELTFASTVLDSTGLPLPAAISLTPTFPDPAGPFDQLERVEGMRVSAGSLTVSGPTLGSLTESTATSTSTGVFYGVITGVPRPFKEPGIQAPDPAPSGGGTIPPIPRFDSNPERIRVDSDAQAGGPLIDVGAGAVVTGLVGPLDYTFRTYTIDPDPGAPIGVAGGATATSAAAQTGQEFTVGTYNMQRFFDTVDDPGKSDAVLTAGAYVVRLNKASLGIRNHLRMPDILGVVEMENLTTLQDLADAINADAVAASQPDPQYAAYLVEGNDIGGIDVGFLVKTAEVAPGTPRVEVVDVQQELAATLFNNPDSSSSLLNDRPPLRLNAIVHHPNGASFPVTVIVNHLRSLGSVNSEATGSSGWTTEGARVRAKRQKQAEDLANLVQARQTADSTEHIILVGDFNAFEVNDGFGHSMGVIAGTPVPDNETAVPGDGVDLVNPDLDNLFDTPPPAERYGYIFDGNAQNLDHVLVNAPLVGDTVARRIEHPRINTDFPETARNNAVSPVRLSDHDPVVGFFQVAAFAVADLSATKVESVDPVTAGTNLAYTITLTNAGPDPADNLSWSDTLPIGTTFVSLAEPGGWSCSTPAVGSGGDVSCSIASLGVTSAAFTLTVAVGPGVASGTVLSNTVNAESNTASASATETTTVAVSADLDITKDDALDPIVAGTTQTYSITVVNDGPSDAASVTWTDTLPAGTTFVSLSAPGGWSCNTPAVGSGGTVDCSIASLGVGSSADFTLQVDFDAGLADGTVVSNTADATTICNDPDDPDATSTETTTVATTSADLVTTKVDSVDPIVPGGTQTYTITVTNNGPNNAVSASWTDTLPAGTTFLSLPEPAGWTCDTPAVGSGGMITCSTSSLAVDSPVGFTLQVVFDPGLADGTLVTNFAVASSETTEGSPEDEVGVAETTVSPSGDYFTVTPCRAVDTRAATPLQDGVPQTFALHGICGIPSTATTVVLNVTVVEPTGSGDLTIHASDVPAPGFSTMPFSAGRARSLIAIVSLSRDAAGEVEVLLSVAGGGTADLVIDLMGYFE